MPASKTTRKKPAAKRVEVKFVRQGSETTFVPKPVVRPKAKQPSPEQIAEFLKSVEPPLRPGTPSADPNRVKPHKEWLVEYVRTHQELIFEMYAEGMSFRQIADVIESAIPRVIINPTRLRAYMIADPEMCRALEAVIIDRAHNMVEQAVVHANQAADAGESKAAADIKLRVAEKLAPKVYGPKASFEFSGPNGGPIETAVTPAEAYQRMLKGS